MGLAKLLVFTLFASTCLAAEENECSFSEFKCSNNKCIETESICDGTKDCPDGEDEMRCARQPGIKPTTPCVIPNITNSYYEVNNSSSTLYTGSNVDLIIKMKCVPGYEIIGDENMICNKGKWTKNFPECQEISYRTPSNTSNKCRLDEFKCNNGLCINTEQICDEIKDCSDGEDEVLCGPKAATSEKLCTLPPYPRDGRYTVLNNTNAGPGNKLVSLTLTVSCDKGFNAYGEATVSCTKNKWNKELPDCLPIIPVSVLKAYSEAIATTTTTTHRPRPTGPCVLPPYPEHSIYSVTDEPTAVPGDGFDIVELYVTCDPGYGVLGDNEAYCFKGRWIKEIPRCIRLCQLSSHPSVEYRCILSGGNRGFRPCEGYEPHGTQVIPNCRKPNYYTPIDFNYMTCINGHWNYVAKCLPDCGKVSASGKQLVIDGRNAEHGELPWHVGIYRKTSEPYKQICGGSLVSKSVVISAAHCFWSDIEKLLPAENFAVAVGKIYRPWNSPKDEYAQKSDVQKIEISPYFYGSSTNFQDDIAMLTVVKPFEYKTYVRPVCLDFNEQFERTQLQDGNFGQVAGWGLTSEDGKAAHVLQVVTLPYVPIGACIAKSQAGFREYITSDKICAGYGNGKALCKGDSGGGLAFPQYDKFTERFYLRGIVSTAPNNEHACNAYTLTTFTRISSHEHFIKQNLSDE